MGAISVVTYQVKPGRMDDFLSNGREAKSVIEGLAVNLQSIRAFRSSISGPNTGNVAVVFEYGDVSDWGNTIVREADDPTFNELVKKGMGPDSPATIIARGLHTEIAPSAGNGTGSVVQISLGRIKPGRLDDFVSIVKEGSQMVIASGAERTRHFMVTVGGPNTGRVYIATEYRDMAAFGEAWQKHNSDPEWRKVVDATIGPDGPATLESQSLFTEIQL